MLYIYHIFHQLQKQYVNYSCYRLHCLKWRLLSIRFRRIFMFVKEHSKVCFELPETIRVTQNALPLQGTELSSEVG